MKTVSIADFKANFSDYSDKVEKGLELIVTRGRNKKKIFKVSPIRDQKPFKRKLGLLEGKATVVFHDDWKMTTEEFLGFMKYLLDTHTFIWTILDDDKIPTNTRKIIQNTENDIYVSIISFWEFSLKQSLGKLKATGINAEDLPKLAEVSKFLVLPLKTEEASTLSGLPWVGLHKDPFDRMIIWQAIQNNITIISKDSDFTSYLHVGLKLIW